MAAFSLVEYNGSMRKVISMEFPRKISEFLVDKICDSLNIVFPKLFYSFDIEEKSLKVTIPNVKVGKSIIEVSKVETWDTETFVENAFSYKVDLPFSLSTYIIRYDQDNDRIMEIVEFINGTATRQLVSNQFFEKGG